MNKFVDLMRRTRNAAYLKWLAFVQDAVQFLIFCAILISFFSFIPEIQSTDFGVLFFAGALFLIVWVLYAAFDSYEGIRTIDYSTERFGKIRKLSLASVLAIPIAISWITNGSLYGAINPIGYWNDELARNGESKCAAFEEVLVGSADDFRVTQKKFKMGLATGSELKLSADLLKVFSDSHENASIQRLVG